MLHAGFHLLVPQGHKWERLILGAKCGLGYLVARSFELSGHDKILQSCHCLLADEFGAVAEGGLEGAHKAGCPVAKAHLRRDVGGDHLLRMLHIGAGHRGRELVVESPKREPDVVPAEISQAAQGLQRLLHADVPRGPGLVVGAVNAERRLHVPELAEHVAVVQDAFQGDLPLVVHEHGVVHELHSRFSACVDHRLHFSCAGQGLFHQNVLLGSNCFKRQLGSDAGRHGNVHGLDGRISQQLFVTAVGLRSRTVLGDELLSFPFSSGGHRCDYGMFHAADRCAKLASDASAAQDAPLDHHASTHRTARTRSKLKPMLEKAAEKRVNCKLQDRGSARHVAGGAVAWAADPVAAAKPLPSRNREGTVRASDTKGRST